MNNFREKLIRFFSYSRDYNFINIFILTLYSIGLLWFILPISLFEYLLLILIVLTPIFIVHMIEPKDCIPSIEYDTSSSWITKLMLFIKTMFKHYITKYLKSYCLFLIVFLVAGLLICCSSFISISILSKPIQKSLGLSVILLLSSFLLLEGFALILTIISCSTTMIVENVKPITAIFRYKKILRKQFLKHVFTILACFILFLPIAFLSDYLNKYVYVATILRVYYFMIIINFIIFDTKELIAIYTKNTILTNNVTITEKKHKTTTKTKNRNKYHKK